MPQDLATLLLKMALGKPKLNWLVDSTRTNLFSNKNGIEDSLDYFWALYLKAPQVTYQHFT